MLVRPDINLKKITSLASPSDLKNAPDLTFFLTKYNNILLFFSCSSCCFSIVHFFKCVYIKIVLINTHDRPFSFQAPQNMHGIFDIFILFNMRSQGDYGRLQLKIFFICKIFSLIFVHG